MKFRNAQIVFFAVLLSSCSRDAEESVMIYDPVKNKQFIDLLIEKEVSYRLQDDGLIFYPEEKKEIAKEAFEKITGKKIPEYQPSP